MKKLLVVLSLVLALAVAAFAAGHVIHVDPGTNQNTASSISTEEVTALNDNKDAKAGNYDYLGASMLQSAIATTSEATTEQKKASEEAAEALGDNATVVSLATIDTSKINDGVVIPIKVSANAVSGKDDLYAYIGGTLYKGGNNMWKQEANGSTFICIKWKDILNGETASSVELSAEADLLTPIAASVEGGGLSSSGGGCSTGMSALAFGVLGLFLACRKK